MPVCKTCQRERRPSQMGPKEVCSACRTKEFRINNPMYNKNWYVNNKEHKIKKTQEWKVRNREYIREYNREYFYEYRYKRYHFDPEFRAKRIAQGERLLNRSPYKSLPFEQERVAIIYEVAKRITELTGIEHHVDHIVPIKGADVSGLHVACNLRVITASENMSKGNSHVT